MADNEGGGLVPTAAAPLVALRPLGLSVEHDMRPYPGLKPFDKDDRHRFFGREVQTDDILERLTTSHFVAVVGPSGCGKSSLVRAGVLPRLESGQHQIGDSRWLTAIMRPGKKPIDELAKQLRPILRTRDTGELPDIAALDEFLETNPAPLRNLLKNYYLCRSPEEDNHPFKGNLLLLVDQFEEVFGDGVREIPEDMKKFVQLLLDIVSYPMSKIYVIVTMRSEFLGYATRVEHLTDALNAWHYLVPRMHRDQLEDAIRRPAKRSGGEIEQELIDHLLNTIPDSADQLPLIQHLLMWLWDNAPEPPPGEPRRITMQQFQDSAANDINSALSVHADEIFAEIPSPHLQRVAEIMFRCLFRRDQANNDLRRPSTVAEITAIGGFSRDDLANVIERFGQETSYFVVADQPLTGDTVIDICHESLIRSWARYQEWVKAEVEVQYALFKLSAERQRRKAKPTVEYLSETELIQLQPLVAWIDQLDSHANSAVKPSALWAARLLPGKMSEAEETLAFLKDSQIADAEAKKAEVARLKAERKARHIKNYVMGTAAALVLAVVVGVIVFTQQQSNQIAAKEKQNQALQKVSQVVSSFATDMISAGDTLIQYQKTDMATDRSNHIKSVMNLLKQMDDFRVQSQETETGLGLLTGELGLENTDSLMDQITKMKSSNAKLTDAMKTSLVSGVKMLPRPVEGDIPHSYGGIPFSAIEFSSDGKLVLLTGTHGPILAQPVQDDAGQQMLAGSDIGPQDSYLTLAISPGSRFVAALTEKKLLIWDREKPSAAPWEHQHTTYPMAMNFDRVAEITGDSTMFVLVNLVPGDKSGNSPSKARFDIVGLNTEGFTLTTRFSSLEEGWHLSAIGSDLSQEFLVTLISRERQQIRLTRLLSNKFVTDGENALVKLATLCVEGPASRTDFSYTAPTNQIFLSAWDDQRIQTWDVNAAIATVMLPGSEDYFSDKTKFAQAGKTCRKKAEALAAPTTRDMPLSAVITRTIPKNWAIKSSKQFSVRPLDVQFSNFMEKVLVSEENQTMSIWSLAQMTSDSSAENEYDSAIARFTMPDEHLAFAMSGSAEKFATISRNGKDSRVQIWDMNVVPASDMPYHLLKGEVCMRLSPHIAANELNSICP